VENVMNKNTGRQISLSKRDDVPQNKIELLVCQSGGYKCKEHLSVINECYLEANNYHFEKDYLNSIKSLKRAFFSTTQLNEESCVKCAALFRSTIAQSIENINGELHNMTTGLFRKKRLLPSYKASCEVLDEIKKEQ
jgi:hypothetical protein